MSTSRRIPCSRREGEGKEKKKRKRFEVIQTMAMMLSHGQQSRTV